MAVACPPATDHPQSGPSAAASQLNFPHNRLSPPEVEDNNLTLFLESLAKALKKPKFENTLQWSNAGRAFIIKDKNRFINEVLP
jgi:hypothetical protein